MAYLQMIVEIVLLAAIELRCISLVQLQVQPIRMAGEVFRPANIPLLASDSGLSYVNWTLCNRSFHSNLDGLGPDSGEKAIRYYNVTTAGGGHAVDLVVASHGAYTANNIAVNGLVRGSECFGVINLKSTRDSVRSVTLKFNLFYHGTTAPVAFNHMFFTVFDIDESNTAKESVTFYDRVNRVYDLSSSELAMTGDLSSGLTFASTEQGNGSDNPTNPESLTTLQKRRAVTVDFKSQHQWKLAFAVEGGRGGRNFVFGGKSNLVDAPTVHSSAATPGPTQSAGNCSVYDDPHINTFDGKQISLLSIADDTLMGAIHELWTPTENSQASLNDMWLVKSSDVKIQARYASITSLPAEKAFVRALAVGGPFLKNNTLVVGASGAGIVSWDGAEILHAKASSFSVPGLITAERRAKSHDVRNMSQPHSGINLELPLGVRLTVNRLPHHVNVFINMPKVAGQDGLCGNFNGNADDDMFDAILANRNPSVKQGESLFDIEFKKRLLQTQSS